MNNPLELTGRLAGAARATAGRVLIIGARRDSRRLARCLRQGPWRGMPVVGFVDAGHGLYQGPRLGRQFAVHPAADPVPVVGSVEQLAQILDHSRATHLVIALTGRAAQRLRVQIEQFTDREVAVHWVGEEPGPADGPDLDLVDDQPVEIWTWPGARLAKRIVDVAGAGFGLLVLSPLFAVVVTMIWISSGRPIFYTQERVGRGGRIFRIIKFRSMRTDAENSTGPIWAADHDARCTRVGSWLRRSNIDELPQLLNVLRGDMSLVGPRPERPIFVERFRDDWPDYDLRHSVPGGMTGWAQVHGWRGRTSLRKRLQYDLDYIQRWTFWFDFKILFMTVQHVFQGKTSWSPPRKGPPA
ncbi:MAG: sugar transferase [Planctomycetota bacterium]|nr:sugar transferase [Planctomycetota bacterium]